MQEKSYARYMNRRVQSNDNNNYKKVEIPKYPSCNKDLVKEIILCAHNVYNN